MPRSPAAGTILIRDISHLVTQSEALGEIADAAIFIRGNVIEWVGKTSDLPSELSESADRVIDGKGHVFMPGR
jgi:8-oxoguanine deaminase